MPTIVDSLRENLAAQFWQFAQVSGNDIEVRYKAIGSPDARREKAFAALVRQLLEENYNVTYRHLEKLPLTSSGKFLKYSYEVKSIK